MASAHLVAPTRITPHTDMAMLTHCRRVGYSRERAGISKRVSRGMVAMMVPLSLALVIWMPRVSAVKYRRGWKSTMRSRGLRDLPFRSMWKIPSRLHSSMATKARKNRQLSRVKGEEAVAPSRTAMKLKPKKIWAIREHPMPTN